jgi:hypothetical protein
MDGRTIGGMEDDHAGPETQRESSGRKKRKEQADRWTQQSFFLSFGPGWRRTTTTLDLEVREG